MFKKGILFLSTALCAQIYAQDFEIGRLELSGSACKRDSDVSIIKSPDNSLASILFSDFSAEVGQDSLHSTQKRDTANCIIRFPIRVDKKFRLQSYTLDYRGFSDTQLRSETQFFTEHTLWFSVKKWLAVEPDKSLNRRFRGPASRDIDVSEKITAPAKIANAACGKTMFIDLSLNLAASSNGANDYARIELNTGDFSANTIAAKKQTVKIGFNLVKCTP